MTAKIRYRPFIRSAIGFLLLLVLPIILFSQDDSENCDLRIKDKDVTVYSCERSNSNFNSIQASFVIETSLERYVDIMLDVNRYPEWHKEIKDPKVVKRFSDTELVYSAIVEAPWPVTDRYMALHLTVEKDEERQVVYLHHTLAEEYREEMEGMIWMKEYNSLLKLSALTGNMLQVELQVDVDPGGSIPSWLINMLSARIPVNTYSSIIRRAKELEGTPLQFNSVTSFESSFEP